MLKVMFVCLGNICRSAMAECVMSDMVKRRGLEKEFVIDSAGTSDEEEGNGIYPPAVRKLDKEGVPALYHRAKKLRKEDYDAFDLFLCAEQNNVTNAKRIFGGDKDNKVVRMLDFSGCPRNIADPWWTGDFDKTYTDVVEACESLIAYATENALIGE